MPYPIAGLSDESLIPQRNKEMPGSEWGAPSARAFVLRPQPQTVIDEPPPELNIPQFLPPDILDQLGKNWYTGEPGQKGTGKSQTFEEQQFVLNYLAQYGMKPEAGAGTELQQSGTYTPESTMGKMGFQTYQDYLNAQRVGEPFGPYAGGDVPQGGLVVTDKEGRPLNRYMDINRPEAQQALAEGRYINPLTGPLAESFRGGLPTSEKYYPKPPGEMPQLGMEEAIKQYGTPQMYLQGLSDYLPNLVRQDRDKVDQAYKKVAYIKQLADINISFNNTSPDAIDALYELIKRYGDRVEDVSKRWEAGKFSFEELEGVKKLEDLTKKIGEEVIVEASRILEEDALKRVEGTASEYWTEEKAKREYAKIQDAIAQGTPIDQLPFLKEVSPTIWQMAVQGQTQQYEAQQKEQPAPWGGYPEMEKGTQDIAGIINGLDTTPEYRRYLLSNIEYLRQLWEQSGEPDFYTWLLSYQGVR